MWRTPWSVIGDKNDQLAHAAWKFLTGLELDKGEPSLANVTKMQLDSSIEFASVLRCLGLGYSRVEMQKQLLFPGRSDGKHSS